MTTVLRDTFFVSLSGKRQFELASRLIEIGSTANESVRRAPFILGVEMLSFFEG